MAVLLYKYMMRYYISSSTTLSVLEEVWHYCQQHSIQLHHGRILHEVDYIGWYVECDADPKMDFLLLKYSDLFTVLSNSTSANSGAL